MTRDPRKEIGGWVNALARRVHSHEGHVKSVFGAQWSTVRYNGTVLAVSLMKNAGAQHGSTYVDIKFALENGVEKIRKLNIASVGKGWVPRAGCVLCPLPVEPPPLPALPPIEQQPQAAATPAAQPHPQVDGPAPPPPADNLPPPPPPAANNPPPPPANDSGPLIVGVPIDEVPTILIPVPKTAGAVGRVRPGAQPVATAHGRNWYLAKDVVGAHVKETVHRHWFLYDDHGMPVGPSCDAPLYELMHLR